MKKIVVFTLFMFPAIMFSQKITKSEYDKFIKKYSIETNDITIWKEFNRVLLSFTSIDSSTSLVTSNYGRLSGVVRKGDKIIFLLNNDSTVEAFSKKTQFYDVSERGEVVGTVNNHIEYAISIDALKTLQLTIVKALRIYNNNGYIDIDINNKESKNINALTTIFLKEFQEKQSQFKK